MCGNFIICHFLKRDAVNYKFDANFYFYVIRATMKPHTYHSKQLEAILNKLFHRTQSVSPIALCVFVLVNMKTGKIPLPCSTISGPELALKGKIH